MTKKTRKVLSIAAALALLLSFTTTAIAAGANEGNGHSNTGKAFKTEEKECRGASDQKPACSDRKVGICSALSEAISNLSEDDKDTLSDYITTYEKAVSAEASARESADEDDDLSAYREAVINAAKALIDAAEDADIDLGLPDYCEEYGDGPNGLWHGQFCTVKEIDEAISNLSEDDKDTLSDYITAYEKAVAAEASARESADEDDDLSAYREAVIDAIKALIDAAEDADIDLDLPESGPQNSNGMGRLFGGQYGRNNTAAIEEAISNLSEDDQDALSDYIEAYEDAVDAAEDAEEGEDLAACRKAVNNALKALVEAARDAGIEFGLPLKNK